MALTTRLIARLGTGLIRCSSTYKAARLEKFEKPLDIENLEPKKLKAGEARINVKCCSVNPTDILLSGGINPAKFSIPIVPGYELTGIIEEVNECNEIVVGDRVVALSKQNLGGFAQKCVVNEKDIWLLPGNISFETGAALVDSFGTALLGLFHRSKIDEKKVVLVTFAPAHGYAALDIAANVYKAKVIAVCINDGDTDDLRKRGAWSALPYSEKHMLSTVASLTKKQGVDVVYDTLAGDVLRTGLKCVRHEGNIIVAGYTLKELPQVSISELLSLPSFSITGVSLTSYRKHNFEMYRKVISDVIEMKEQGLISPFISSRYPLTEVNEALNFIKTKLPIGKVVLEMDK